jgi:hypothetical protein
MHWDSGIMPLIAAGAALLAVLWSNIYFLGRKMSEPEKMLRPIPGGLTPFEQQTLARYRDWLASRNLEYRTSFQFGGIRVAVFQQGDAPRFFNFFFHQKLAYAAESYLENLDVLDTTSSGDLGLFPRPGAYLQGFPNMPPEVIWQRHLEGEAHLTAKFGYKWRPLHRSYEEILVQAMRIRMKYNRAQPFWPLRVLFRYATRRRLVNRTIAQQFP